MLLKHRFYWHDGGMRIILSITFLFLAGLTQAQANYSADVGTSFTDNANLESQNKHSDLVLSATAQATGRADENDFGLRLNYRDYAKENTNDNFSWRIYDHWKPEQNSWSYIGALIGRQYVNGSPGLTDTSFSNVGGELKAEQSTDVIDIGELTYGPGVRGRYYSGSASRSDHQAFGFIDFERQQSLKLQIGASSEVGYLQSSDTLYSQFDFELSGNIQYSIESDLSWYTEIFTGKNMFTNRTVDIVTIASTNRKGTRTNTSKEYELFTTFGFTSEIIKKFNSDLEGRLGFTTTNQNSKSGSQDYAVNEIYVNLTSRF